MRLPSSCFFSCRPSSDFGYPPETHAALLQARDDGGADSDNILGDVMYHVVDPRIDFEAREV